MNPDTPNRHIADMAEFQRREFAAYIEPMTDAEVDALVYRIFDDAERIETEDAERDARLERLAAIDADHAERDAYERRSVARAIPAICAVVLIAAVMLFGFVFTAKAVAAQETCVTREVGGTGTIYGGSGPVTLGAVTNVTAVSVVTADGPYAGRRNVKQTGEKVNVMIGGNVVLTTTDVPDPTDVDQASVTSAVSFSMVSGVLVVQHARPSSEGPNSVRVSSVTVTECTPPTPPTTTATTTPPTVAPPATTPTTTPATTPTVPTTPPPTTVPDTVPTTTTTAGPPATVCPDGTPISSMDECDAPSTPPSTPPLQPATPPAETAPPQNWCNPGYIECGSATLVELPETGSGTVAVVCAFLSLVFMGVGGLLVRRAGRLAG